MPVTVNVNSLSVVHKGSNGISMATIPDICKTPSPAGPVPIPYPNISMSSDLADGTTTVKIDGNSAAVKGCNFSMSTGDEAGSAGGVKSGKIKGKSEFILSSMDVKLDGKNACRLTDKKTQNEANTVDLGGVLQAPILQITANSSAMEKELKAIAQKCHKDVEKKDKATKAKKKKGESCTVRGTRKHKCCEQEINKSKAKPNSALKNIQPEMRHDDVGCRLDAALIGSPAKRGGVIRIYDFKFNCKGDPKMSQEQQKKYYKEFGCKVVLIGPQ